MKSILFLLIPLSFVACGQTPTFETTLRIPKTRFQPKSVVQNEAGDFVVTGRYDPDYDPNRDKRFSHTVSLFIQVITAEGDSGKTVFIPEIVEGEKIISTRDHGYVVTGFCMNHHERTHEYDRTQGVEIVKLDQNLDITWKTILPGNFNSTPESLAETKDGHYLVLAKVDRGPSQMIGYETGGGRIVLLDQNGNVKKDAGTIGSFYPYDICTTPDGSALVAGTSAGWGGHSFYVSKLDSSLFRQQWAKEYHWKNLEGKERDCWGYSVCSLKAGGYVLAGGSDFHEYHLAGISPEGNETWNLGLEGELMNHPCVIECSDGNCVMAGQASEDMLILVKVSTSGQILWKQKYATQQFYEFGGLTETADGGFVLVSEVKTTQGMGFFMMKTDGKGQLRE